MSTAVATRARRRSPSLRDRVIASVARLLARSFFRSVETIGPRPGPGPVILAASHLNGMVDPVLLVAELGALPRFLAKSTLWKLILVRPLLGFVRMIPVYRRQDTDGPVDNRSTFGAAVAALRSNHLVAIFPEGTTHDDPSLRPLRTGAARIALQAAAEGVEGVRIVPVGMAYEDKVAVRGRALITFGPAIAISPPADPQDDRAEVKAVTEQVTTALRRLSPDFGSTEDAEALRLAAAITLRSTPPSEVTMARTAAVARQVQAQDQAVVVEVVSTVARYQMMLGVVGLTDEDLQPGVGLTRIVRRIALLGALVVVLAPFAVAGLFANLVPALLVLAAGLAAKAPVSKGTRRLLVAILAFPLTWGAIAVLDGGRGWAARLGQQVTYPLDSGLDWAFDGRTGVGASLAVFVAVPVLGAIALLLADRFRALLRDLEVWHTLLDRRGQLAEIRIRRASVVELTRRAAGLDG